MPDPENTTDERTVAVRMGPETQKMLQEWREHVGLKSDSEAIRAAIRQALRSVRPAEVAS